MTLTAPPRSVPSSARPPEAPPDAGLRATAAVAAAVLAAALSLSGVLEGASWLLPLAFCVLAALGAGAAARRLRAPLPVVPAAELAALGLALCVAFAAEHNLLGVVPTGASVRHLGVLLDQAQAAVSTQVIPVLAEPGVVFLTCLGVGLMAVLTDTLAVTLRMPATAGAGLLAVLIVPAVIKPNSVGALPFILAAGGYIAMLVICLRREDGGAEDSRRPPLAAVGVSCAALVLALVVPLAVPGFTSGSFPQGARFQLGSGGSGLNPVVTLGSDLRRPTATGRITYATDAADPVYLRSTTVEDFAGARWGPTTRDESRRRGVSTMVPAEAALAVPAARTTTRVSSRTYSSPWLLAPYAATSVSGLDGAWSWDPRTMSIRTVDGGSSSGADYEVQSLDLRITREQLAALPAAPGDALDPVFTDLPDNVPQSLADAARQATADAGGPYEQAMALQAYLRGPEFSYSLEAPVDGGYDGNGMSVLEGFMRERSGYCIHFAAAMAVMARELGIPSRMALGYAPGRATGEVTEGSGGIQLREYAVDARDAHAWPELYFEGAGWVRFEPTPSRGSVPAYAREPQAGPEPVREDDIDPRSGQEAPPVAPPRIPAPADSPEASSEAPAETGMAPWAGVLVGLLAAVGALLAPWQLRRHRRARRRAAAEHPGHAGPPAAAAWQEAVDLGQDYGTGMRTADTAAGYAARLAAGLDAEGAEAVNRLRAAFEQESYARSGYGAGSPPAADWSDVRRLHAALDASSGPVVRIKARVLPASLGRARP